MKNKLKEKDKQVIIGRKKKENISQQPTPIRQKNDKQLKLSNFDIDKIIEISREKKIKGKNVNTNHLHPKKNKKRKPKKNMKKQTKVAMTKNVNHLQRKKF